MILAQAKSNIIEWAENEFNIVTSSTDELIKEFWYWMDEDSDHHSLEQLFTKWGVDVFFADEHSIVHTKKRNFELMLLEHSLASYDCGSID